MASLPEQRTEQAFADFKPPYTAAQAVREANRCLYCGDAPCITACPTGIDIPEFIRKIATGNVRGSARTIFDANILGMSCARVCPVEVLCVGDCVFNRMAVPPIQIGKLQRYATDAAFERGWRYHEAGPDSGMSVGLVGGGPASLAALHALRVHGHSCTIYEKHDHLGGLNTFGVAPYKMRADRALEEVAWVLDIGGVELRTNVSIPQDEEWAALVQRHDALFIGIGKGQDTLLDLPGSDLPGVVGAIDHIERLKSTVIEVSGVQRAAVLGAGNTAIDCVRELCGLGIPEVTLVYRGAEHEMKGYAHEWAEAKRAGARALWRHAPVSFEDRGGRLGEVRCCRMDEERRPVSGSELSIPADLALVAIGQAGPHSLLAGLEGVVCARGRIVVDENGATARAGVFAGGDCANGGKEVVNAVEEGKRAAEAIHAWLSQEKKHA